jgi:hypothetical protein
MLLGILPTAIRTCFLPYKFSKFPSVSAWKRRTTVYFHCCASAYVCVFPATGQQTPNSHSAADIQVVVHTLLFTQVHLTVILRYYSYYICEHQRLEQ